MHAARTRMPIPQTNLQLYRQMLEANYDESALDLANRAYLFAARQTCNVLRGSGKPFPCHLVGTAGILVEEGQSAACIGAALLHAMYQDRVPFPGNASLGERREHIRSEFGANVEQLVHEYHHFEVVRLDDFNDGQLRERETVVMMRLADELEDLLDHGVAMHGKPGDDETAGGSAASRRAQKARIAPEFLRAARAIKASQIETRLNHWLKETANPDWPDCLRTGEYSSFGVRGNGFQEPETGTRNP